MVNPKRTSAMASGICALAAVVLVAAGVSRVGGYIPVLASNQTVTVVPTADAYVSAAAPTTNYGSATTLTVGSSPVYHSYLLFSISGLTGTVTSAELILHADTAGSGVALHQSQSTTWSESTITYANAPTFGSLLTRDGQFQFRHMGHPLGGCGGDRKWCIHDGARHPQVPPRSVSPAARREPRCHQSL